MKIKYYQDMKIQVFDKSPLAREQFKTACDITIKQQEDISQEGISRNLIKKLVESEHTSIFEHANITFMAVGISRSLLAQLTRQRTFSFTSASQHYQEYSDYPCIIDKETEKEVQTIVHEAFEHSIATYKTLLSLEVPVEEARQVLSNATAVNLMITANPRALALFFRQRLCHRNVKEMLIFANRLYRICRGWIPELFDYIGPPCLMDGGCNQQNSCQEGPWILKPI